MGQDCPLMSDILVMNPVIRDSWYLQLISKAVNAFIILLFESTICILLALFVNSITYILLKVHLHCCKYELDGLMC